MSNVLRLSTSKYKLFSEYANKKAGRNLTNSPLSIKLNPETMKNEETLFEFKQL